MSRGGKGVNFRGEGIMFLKFSMGDFDFCKKMKERSQFYLDKLQKFISCLHMVVAAVTVVHCHHTVL